MTNFSRRTLLAGLAGMALTGTVTTASARRATASAGATFAEINCNWSGYSAGQTAEGFDLTWATGTGTARKYIRAQRLADFLRTKVQASLYSVIECDTQMAKDLCYLMGSQWKYVGCVDVDNDKNGWLYDSAKWTPGSLATLVLPGGGNRRLLSVGMTHKASGIMLSTSVTHLSSNAPGDRALQMDAVLDALEGKNRIMGADLNASADASGDCSGGATSGPRTQLDCRGWDGYGQGTGGFHGYDSDATLLDIDYIGVSPEAQANGKIIIGTGTTYDTRTTMCTDHMVLKVPVTFS